MSIVPLIEAGPDCGNKASGLGALMRAGLPVPDGFVVTDATTDRASVAGQLRRLCGRAFAVRSSGLTEDSAAASFAGQWETVLGVTTAADVLAAVDRCAASGQARRTRSYRERLGLGEGEASAPVIVQVLVEADCAGVLFTRDPRTGGDSTVINASWGLGESVVSGAVVPDEFIIARSGSLRVSNTGTKQTRLDWGERGLVRTSVPAADQARDCLPRTDIAELARLGWRCEALFGQPQDVEWAARAGQIWFLQSRPITTLGPLSTPAARPGPAATLLTGAASSPGRGTGPVRVVPTVDDFSRVRPGDVLVCRTTDPAWTPLFRLAAAVITETGGVLSHAAIVAREYGIPAICGVEKALSQLYDDQRVTVDGSVGTITAATTDADGASR